MVKDAYELDCPHSANIQVTFPTHINAEREREREHTNMTNTINRGSGVILSILAQVFPITHYFYP